MPLTSSRYYYKNCVLGLMSSVEGPNDVISSLDQAAEFRPSLKSQTVRRCLQVTID